MRAVGYIAQAIRKDAAPANESTFNGFVEKEIYDVIYCALAVANL